MNSTDSIIKKIIADATSEADTNTSLSRNKAEEMLNVAKASADILIAKAKEGLQASSEEILKRRITVANLEAKKQILASKSKLVDKVFDEAYISALKLDKGEYLKLITGMIKACATNNDKIIISIKDKDIITKAFIDKLVKSLKIDITLDSTFGDFEGGIIISNKNYDKNLTLRSELSVLKQQLEHKTVEILFNVKES